MQDDQLNVQENHLKPPSIGDMLAARIADMVLRFARNERYTKSDLAALYRVSERTISRDLARIDCLQLNKDEAGRFYASATPGISQTNIIQIAQALGLEKALNLEGGGLLIRLNIFNHSA